MADIQQAIRLLKTIASIEGADAVTAKLKEMGKAQGDVAVASDKSQKASLSLEASFDKLERRYVSTIRQQQDYAKVQTKVEAATKQNPALMERGNTILAEAALRYGQAGIAARAFQAATSGVSSQLIALSAGAGPVGTFLAALGPWGLAAAVGLGAAEKTIGAMADAADHLAAKAQALNNFKNTTGLSVLEIQALQEAASDFGITSQDVSGFVDHFATQLTALRTASGPLYDILRKIDPVLAQQALTAKGTASELEILAAAYKKAGEDGPALLRAAGGRGGVNNAPLIGSIADAGSISQLADAMNKASFLTDKETISLQKLKAENDSVGEHIRDNIASIFSNTVLSNQVAARKELEGITEWMKGFHISDEWKTFTEWFDKTSVGKFFGGGQLPGQTKSGGVAVPVGGVTAGGALPPATAATVLKESPEATANKYKELVTALGSAANATERLRARQLDLDAQVAKGVITRDTYNRALGGAQLDTYIELLNLHNTAMGNAASTTDVVNAKMATLQKQQQQGAGLTSAEIENQRRVATEQANGTAAILSQVDATKIQAATLGMSAGAAAKTGAMMALLAQDIRNGKIATEEDTIARQKAVEQLGAEAQALEKLNVARQIKFDKSTMWLTPEDVQIAQQLRGIYGDDVPAALASSEAAAMRLNNTLKDMKGYALDFGNALNSALAQGKSPKEAIGAGVDAIGTKLSNNLMNAGIASGNPALIAASVGISILQGQAAKAKQAKADFDAAVKAWQDMQTEVRHFTDTLEGRNTGSLGQSIASMTEKAQKYADAAHKAGQSADALNASLIVFVQKATTDFVNAFGVTVEALNQGLGNDSPAVKAQANVKQIGDTLKGFIDDAIHAGQGLAQAQPAIAAATMASQNYALSLLQTKPALTDTQTAILNLRGTAQQLQSTLVDLGMSSDAAAQSIATGVNHALSNIASDLTDSLNRQLNEATGKGYVNQLNDLITKTLANLSDADLTGVDTSLVAKLFTAQAQGIVDGYGLIGAGFDDLIKQFPQLAGVLSQSKSALDTFSKNIEDFLNGLKLGSLSTLSPTQRLATAQSIYDTTLASAQGGNTDAMAKYTDAATQLATIAKDYFASSPDYAHIFDKIQKDGASLPGKIAASGNKTTNALVTSNSLLGSVDTNTDNTVSTLTALQSLQAATSQSSIDISSSVVQLGAQGAYVADRQGSQYFGPMVNLLTQIAANTLLTGQAQSDPGSGFTWWNPFTWFHDGGIVGRHAMGGIVGAYAPGGIVGNGVFNMDSVRASYAAGGDIALAGGEGIINANATRMIGPSVIDFMNRTGRMPANDNGFSGRDYTPHFNTLAQSITRALGAAAAAQIAALQDENKLLRATIKGNAPSQSPRVRGTKVAAQR